MRIALAQMDVTAGNPEKNVEKMIAMMDDARSKGAELVVFPELCVGGYFVGDRWLEDDWLNELLYYNGVILQHARGICVVYGNVAVDFDKRGRDGRCTKYNAAYVVKDGRLFWEAKTLLPNYRIFDDQRYFTPRQTGRRQLFDVAGRDMGVIVCEDMWSNDYDSDPVIELIEQGADFIVCISASPWTYGKNYARDKQISILERKAGKLIPFYYVNNVGVQNNGKNIITFDGDTAVYADGERLHGYDLAPYEEGIIYVDDDNFNKAGERRLPSRIEQKYNAIIRGIRGFDEMMGDWRPNFVIGLSGGVDSSLVAVLMTRALGKERIFTYNLPSVYNSSATRSSARKLADRLGVCFKDIAIQELVELNREVLKKSGLVPGALAEENIQAKIRGTSILSNLAAMHNGLMTNNGNKLEIALGYATLYGDVNGAIAPIGDLTKDEVFEMCKWINSDEELVPSELLPDDRYNFEIAPSAELKENQRDPMKFGYHDRLIEHLMDYRKKSPEHFMEWYLEGKDSFCEKMGISEDIFMLYELDKPDVFVSDLEWFVSTMRRSIFKRIQAPPVILLSRTAFGYDLRESQFPWMPTRRYLELRERVIKSAGAY
ncbi:NAD(+) synthase [Spirochaetia bacterium 38H-sp]|uniref:Glutamine-dependent NAD(+) synthetase n=1 Tax=Rarispira pelagica TaxID=3141764 RepID=A0ABU9UDX7_9SPIR